MRGSWGSEHTVTPGVLDERAFAAFTEGQCHALALALNEQTGWTIVGVEDEELDIMHFCVRMPDGRLFDVAGAFEPEEYLRLEHVDGFCPDLEYLVDQAPEWVARLGEDPDWRIPDVETARSFVAPLLERSDVVPAPAGV